MAKIQRHGTPSNVQRIHRNCDNAYFYEPPLWMKHIHLVLMLPVVILWVPVIAAGLVVYGLIAYFHAALLGMPVTPYFVI